MTVEQWQAMPSASFTIANINTDPQVRLALEDEGIKPNQDPWINVDSSWIDAVAYTQSNSTLTIRLNSGAIYQYDCVPPQLFCELLDASSKGSFVNRYIKDAFPYRLL